jgi:hydrogenase-4 membrane subunit HyfE
MSPLLIAFVGVLLVPLFVASWRLSLLALAAQALLMAWISYQLDPSLDSAHAWVRLFDLVAVRGIGAPLVLYAVLRSQRASARNDIIPPNLISLTLAIALVFVAFRFTDMMVPVESNEHALVVGATAGLLLGLLVLATQTGPFSQMVGALRIENGIAFFEIGASHRPLAMLIAQTVILIVTVLLFRWYLRSLPRASTAKVSAVEGMNL